MKERRAQVKHTCKNCGKQINKGRKMLVVTHKGLDGIWNTYYYHPGCKV